MAIWHEPAGDGRTYVAEGRGVQISATKAIFRPYLVTRQPDDPGTADVPAGAMADLEALSGRPARLVDLWLYVRFVALMAALGVSCVILGWAMAALIFSLTGRV